MENACINKSIFKYYEMFVNFKAVKKILKEVHKRYFFEHKGKWKANI